MKNTPDNICTNVFKSGSDKPDCEAVTQKWVVLICSIEKLKKEK